MDPSSADLEMQAEVVTRMEAQIGHLETKFTKAKQNLQTRNKIQKRNKIHKRETKFTKATETKINTSGLRIQLTRK